jgi:hypothetical protein
LLISWLAGSAYIGKGISTTAEQVQVREVPSRTDDVFYALDLIAVKDCWDRSGCTRDGYISPDEAADEIIEEELHPFFVSSGVKVVENPRFEIADRIQAIWGGHDPPRADLMCRGARRRKGRGLEAFVLQAVDGEPADLDGVCARAAAAIRGRGGGRACGAVEQRKG